MKLKKKLLFNNQMLSSKAEGDPLRGNFLMIKELANLVKKGNFR